MLTLRLYFHVYTKRSSRTRLLWVLWTQFCYICRLFLAFASVAATIAHSDKTFLEYCSRWTGLTFALRGHMFPQMRLTTRWPDLMALWSRGRWFHDIAATLSDRSMRVHFGAESLTMHNAMKQSLKTIMVSFMVLPISSFGVQPLIGIAFKTCQSYPWLVFGNMVLVW